MPETSILIVGPPSPLRDHYELSVRRHATDILLCENCESAFASLKSAAVRAVIVLAAADEREVEEFLALVRGEYPHVPVFFAGAGESIRELPLRYGTVVLPSDLPTGQIEQLLFPPPPLPVPAAETARPEERTIPLGAREYPFQFARARALFETEFLTGVLKRERGNVSRTARAIGMARRNLQIKIQAYRIDIARIRHEP